MIEKIKKILGYLTNNIECYSVYCYDTTNCKEIRWDNNGFSYSLLYTMYNDIHNVRLTIRNHNNFIVGNYYETSVPEDEQYSVLDLIRKLDKSCNNYTINKITEFFDKI